MFFFLLPACKSVFLRQLKLFGPSIIPKTQKDDFSFECSSAVNEAQFS